MGNTKTDAKGNELPEVIGNGLNLEHLRKVEKARKMDSFIKFRITDSEKIKFQDACEEVIGLNESQVLRALVIAFTNGKIQIK
jgi:hypothetical protein